MSAALQALRASLSRAIASGRLPHAVLLTGAAGVGKAALARELAQGLFCTEESVLGGCGACRHCRLVASAEHPDLSELRRPADKRQIPVESLRAFVAQLDLAPLEGRGRVAILPCADDLAVEGQNALLKTLEEPAPASWILLCTHRPEAMLATIRSRCARIALPSMQVADLAALLVREEGLPPADARKLAELAAGSRGEALRLAEEGLGAWEELFAALGGGAVAWAERALRGPEAASTQLQRDRAARVCRVLGLFLLARGDPGRHIAALEGLCKAQADLAASLPPRLVLQALHRELGGLSEALSPATP